MKQLKKILIIIICSMFITGCNNSNKLENIGKIQNLTTSTKEIPTFTIVIRGITNDVITEKSVSDLTLYDFAVDVQPYDLDPNSEIYHEKWTGIKLKDVLEKKDITTFDNIDFIAIGRATVRYTKEEINDNLYLVFYRNDIALSETESTPVMLFAPNLKHRYWVPSLKRMDII